ncbi:MAG TPA: succinate dehydrogenase, cytochrome b556 subunit [Alphaproteobacteria bacterium]|nr:succinate dehydrogenase, cytochrome b556 subunit [Alphaproteobacteria bacterium]
MPDPMNERRRPQSPNIQIYRPQLTSVLSIANRISGVVMSVAAVGLVLWLLAVAAGPETYAIAHNLLTSVLGRIVLLAVTFSFFLHLCGSIRHLVWDAGYGFELAAIYASGWAVVAASVVLTVAAWVAGLFMVG